MIERYVKLPVDVRAVQFDGRNGEEIVNWVNEHPGMSAHSIVAPVETGQRNPITVTVTMPDGHTLKTPAVIIHTPYGEWVAERGDWVICDEFNVVTTAEPDVFEEDYAAYEAPFEDECREVLLPNGETMIVRGADPMNEQEAAALGEIVEATRQIAADPELMAAFQERSGARPVDVHLAPMGADEVRIVTNVADQEIVVTCPRCEGTITRLTEIDERISYRSEIEAAIARHLAEQSAMHALKHNVRQRDGEQQQPAEAADIHDLLIADIEQRRDEQYGEYTNDPLADAYEDALSLVINLRQALAQRFNPNP